MRMTFRPALEPSVQVPPTATPSEPVVAVVALSEPPPESTANVTTAPTTGCPAASLTTTAGLTGSALPAVACWLSPAWTVRDAGVPVGAGLLVAVLPLPQAAARTSRAGSVKWRIGRVRECEVVVLTYPDIIA